MTLTMGVLSLFIVGENVLRVQSLTSRKMKRFSLKVASSGYKVRGLFRQLPRIIGKRRNSVGNGWRRSGWHKCARTKSTSDATGAQHNAPGVWRIRQRVGAIGRK